MTLRDTEYQPVNEVARYKDKYGDEVIIHEPKGRTLRRYKGAGTPVMRMNRAVAQLMGELLKKRRIKQGLTMRELCQKAGFVDVSPKERIWGIENAIRGNGIRLGTLYALATALECQASKLLPVVEDVLELAEITLKESDTII